MHLETRLIRALIGHASGSSALLITGQSRPWSDRYHLSVFNDFQHSSTRFNISGLAALKRLEQLAAVTFRTSLEGRSTHSVGRELLES
jgi:hypothetical protein